MIRREPFAPAEVEEEARRGVQTLNSFGQTRLCLTGCTCASDDLLNGVTVSPRFLD